MKKNEENFREMWNTIKCTNILIMENTRRQKGTEKTFKKKISTNRYIIIKTVKVKDK